MGHFPKSRMDTGGLRKIRFNQFILVEGDALGNSLTVPHGVEEEGAHQIWVQHVFFFFFLNYSTLFYF